MFNDAIDARDEARMKEAKEKNKEETTKAVVDDNCNSEETGIILTTTPRVEGRVVTDYLGIVFGEVIEGADFFKDLSAGLSDIFGGRVNEYEKTLQKARHEAFAEMKDRAAKLGANAIIGINLEYEVLGANNGMLMVNVQGTAVKTMPINE